MLKVNLVKIRRWCIERRFNFDLDPYAADNQLFRGVQYFDYEELFKRFRFLKKTISTTEIQDHHIQGSQLLQKWVPLQYQTHNTILSWQVLTIKKNTNTKSSE